MSDLAERIGMSYMGTKGICLDLEKRGLLDTWRQPQKIGRPLLVYRLTQRAHDLFPTASNDLTIELLEAARKLFGAAAPEKLLLVVFQQKTENYLAKLRPGSLQERATWLARLRDHDGHMAECITEENGAVKIVEHHSPVLDVLQAFPLVARLETEMFQKILGVTVIRVETVVSGVYCATFEIPPTSVVV